MGNCLNLLVGFLGFEERIPLFKSQTDYGSPKLKSVIWFWFPFSKLTRPFSAIPNLLNQGFFFSPWAECLKTNSFPHLSYASKYRHASVLSCHDSILGIYSIHSPQWDCIPVCTSHPYLGLLAMGSPLIHGQSTGTSQSAMTSVARFLY